MLYSQIINYYKRLVSSSHSSILQSYGGTISTKKNRSKQNLFLIIAMIEATWLKNSRMWKRVLAQAAATVNAAPDRILL